MLEIVVIIKDDKASMVDLYPLQRVDDLFTAMSGGVSFSKLDLLHAYLQLQLEKSLRQYITINTHTRDSIDTQGYHLKCCQYQAFSTNHG